MKQKKRAPSSQHRFSLASPAKPIAFVCMCNGPPTVLPQFVCHCNSSQTQQQHQVQQHVCSFAAQTDWRKSITQEPALHVMVKPNWVGTVTFTKQIHLSNATNPSQTNHCAKGNLKRWHLKFMSKVLYMKLDQEIKACLTLWVTDHSNAAIKPCHCVCDMHETSAIKAQFTKLCSHLMLNLWAATRTNNQTWEGGWVCLLG